jgi:hypothetical protein
VTNWFKDLYKGITMSATERYLAQAKDRYDLEQRQKDIAYGKARLF